MLRPAYPQWRRIVTPVALAAVSLLVAIVLWVAVTDAEDPNTVDFFSGSIEVRAVNLPDNRSVASISDPNVVIRVSAPSSVFERLTTADFRAEVNLSGERNDVSERTIRVFVVGDKERDVEVVEVVPRFVTVTLEPTISKLVPVKADVVGSPPQGFSYSGVEPNPSTVRVTGAESLVAKAASASADVNLTGRRVSLDEQFRLTPRDAQGADLRGLSLEPANAEIRVGITQREVTLPLTVVPTTTGSVADGYNLVGITVEPAAMAVSGPLELLQALSFLTTETIDINGLKADTTRSSVRLRVPSGVQPTRETVTVRVKVAPAEGEIAATVAPQVTGLSDNLKAELQTSSITIKIRGEMPTLQSAAGSLRATVSVSGLSEGVHVLTPTVTTPEGVRIASMDPQQVVVVLRR